VRNLPDGTVELHVQGDAETIAHMRRWAHLGPSGARVESVEEHETVHHDLAGFEIRP
jgi:acylphosphatase